MTDMYEVEAVHDLKQFFQRERDKELGRWRWPENPDYVVYQSWADWVHVVDETTGNSKPFQRFWSVFGNSGYDGAARAYFLAHPEPKPWHDAIEGGFWEVKLKGRGSASLAMVSDELKFVFTDMEMLEITDSGIESAERLWPEGV